ncbi:MAG: RNase A-like domain-containing protein [Hydrogenophaga sp.]|nr:RNase A-like domain-containing protein [Hydrogenophaga sp.]
MRLLSILLVLALLGGTLGVAHGQSGGTSASDASNSSFSPVTEECKPDQCFTSVQARQSYAKANSCYFLEDVCDPEGSKGKEQGTWAAAQSFAEGLWDGLGDQIGELLEMLGSPIETAQAVYELAKAFYDDPVGTAKALASLAGEGINNLLIQATQCGAYDLGKVIGQNVSPVVALKVGVRLARYGGKIDDAVRATKLEVGCASFVAGTPVWLDHGSGVQASIVPIERIAIGQSVLSRNDQLLSDQPQRVENTFGRVAPGYWELQTEGESYRLTEEHPVWVQGKGWTEAQEVREDDVLATAMGDTLVRGNTPVNRSIQVYNFSVANTPSYFVGERGLWVHNAKCDIVPGGGLSAHEGKGHTLEKHVNVTTDDLRDRANGRGKYTGERVPGMSSRYSDRATAEAAISVVLADRQPEIQAWLSNPNSTGLMLTSKTPFSKPIGEGVPRGSEQTQSLSNATVILRKDPGSSSGYYILTSHPS